jgi:hypothetical protein
MGRCPLLGGNQSATENSVPIKKQLFRESGTPYCYARGKSGLSHRPRVDTFPDRQLASRPPALKCDGFHPVNNVQNDTSSRNGCRLSSHQLEDVTMPRTITWRVVDRPDVVIDEIVASCNGDMRGAFKALLLVNEQLESELNRLHEAACGSPTEPAAQKSLH